MPVGVFPTGIFPVGVFPAGVFSSVQVLPQNAIGDLDYPLTARFSSRSYSTRFDQ
jgi:hypothetical protein